MSTQNLPFSPNFPSNLGFSKQPNGYYFSFFSNTLHAVDLHLYHPYQQTPYEKIKLNLSQYQEGVWHTTIPNLEPDTEYMLFSKFLEFLDPYAKALSTPSKWGKWDQPLRCQLTFDHIFDWEGVKSPNLSKELLSIYEMHVRGFTKSPTSGCKFPGTYLGVIEKIPYLKELGINAVELMPIFEFDERENLHKSPSPNVRLYNYWGYNTVNFFCPMKRFASSGNRLAAITEFKTLVRELHRNGIEVILDVVYNHVSMKSCLEFIDKYEYFFVDQFGNHMNYSGCGNTIEANANPAKHLILSSLRYFAEEFHVDGFRLDLAGCLAIDVHGKPLEKPALFEEIASDPILSKVKFFGEPWTCFAVNLQGHFPFKSLSEWNGEFKYAVRRFFKGDLSQEDMKNTILGSTYIYPEDRDLPVIYATCHDGFSLKDLVSYEKKHNLGNGENNRDGADNNASVNYGVEGPTDDEQITQERLRHMKNLLISVLFSKGIPLLKMGDEYGMSHMGNNNPYCQDNELSWFNWDLLKENLDLFDFFKKAISLKHSDLAFYQRSSKHTVLENPEPEKKRIAVSIADNYFLFINFDINDWDVSSIINDTWKVSLSSVEDNYNHPTKVFPFSSLIASRR